MPDTQIRLVIADVDGTLVTQDKELTPRAIAAVGGLRQAGIAFAVTSGRPPRGMSMLIGPLGLTTPLSAFNGGCIVDPDLSVLDEKVLPDDLVAPVVSRIEAAGLDAWIYRGADWYVRDAAAPHVDRERWTVQFDPTVVASFDGLTSRVAKIVGVNDDHDAVAAAEADCRARFGEHMSVARSQPYYLDVTHPDANKGAVARWLSQRLSVPLGAVATIGDMPNDVLMFAHAGCAIAMGNASPEVQRAARHVTASNAEDGFAQAMERYVLGADAPK